MRLSRQQWLRLACNAAAKPISECLEMVDGVSSSQTMATKPFPHFEPDPKRPRVFVRIDADGRRTAGPGKSTFHELNLRRPGCGS